MPSTGLTSAGASAAGAIHRGGAPDGGSTGAPTRRRVVDLWPLGLYSLISIAFFGIPVLAHFGSSIIAANDIDPSNYMWCLSWWPHAIGHAINPFITQVIFVPHGYNLTWVASIPLPALVMTPITLLFGPLVSWNVIQLGAPALSAWTAYLLCRHVTRRTGPSLVGGFLFGFSPYMVVHLEGAPQLIMVALLPVFVLLVLRHLEGSLSDRRFVGYMAAAIAAELLTSTEVLVTALLFGGIALLAAVALLGGRRRALLRTTGLIGVAGLISGVAVIPLLVYVIFHPHTAPSQALLPYRVDLLGFVIPGPLQGLHYAPAPAYATNVAYLGVPLCVILALFAWEWRRSRAALVLVISVLAAIVACLGVRLSIADHDTGVTLPWNLTGHIPILRYAIAPRLSLFIFLPAALILAMWMARRERWARWVPAALIVLSILPRFGSVFLNFQHVTDPQFFSSGTYRQYLSARDNVITLPIWGPNMRWQANSGFSFRLSGGYIGAFPESYTRYPTWETLLSGQLTPDYALQLRRYVHDKRVTAIVVDKRYGGPWRTLFAPLGVRPLDTHGVLFYRLRAPA